MPFFGLGTNVLVNLLVLTGLLKFVIKIPDAIFIWTNPAGGRFNVVSGQYLLCLDGTKASRENRAVRCDGAAIRAQRAAYVYRRIRHHAADYAANQGPHQGLGGWSGLGLCRRHCPVCRRLHRADHPAPDTARRIARHPGRNIHYLYLAPARRWKYSRPRLSAWYPW